jgi:very-short-patch-repair endonuclease
VTPQKEDTPERTPIRQFATDLRFNPTPHEQLLWSALLIAFNPYRATIHGQEPIGPYVADFYIAPCNVVAEVDGPYHGDPDQKAKDQRRDKFMRSKGIRIYRFRNDQIQRSAKACATFILNKCLPLENAFGKVRTIYCPPGDATRKQTRTEKRLFWRA